MATLLVTQSMPVNLQEIATKAGVSVSTVSYALSGTGSLAKMTRERIRRIATELGYQADPLFRALAAKRKRAIGSGKPSIALLTGLPTAALRSGRGLMIQGVYDEAALLGYEVETFLQKDCKSRRFGEILYARGFAGLILLELAVRELETLIPWERFSVVQCERSQSRLQFPLIRMNEYDSLRLLWEKLKERGLQRPGYAVFEHDPLRPEEALRKLLITGHCGDPQHYYGLTKQDEISRKPLRAWFKKGHRKMDCLVAHHSALAEDAYGKRREVTGAFPMFSLHITSIERPRYPGLLIPYHQLGVLSMRRLDHAIRHSEYGERPESETISLSATWMEPDKTDLINQSTNAAHLKPDDPDGIIPSKMTDAAGY